MSITNLACFYLRKYQCTSQEAYELAFDDWNKSHKQPKSKKFFLKRPETLAPITHRAETGRVYSTAMRTSAPRDNDCHTWDTTILGRRRPITSSDMLLKVSHVRDIHSNAPVAL